MFTSFPFAFWRGESGTIGLGYRYGYEFDGVDEEISFPNYDISGPFSVSVWFKLIDSGDNVIIGDWGSGTRSWFLRISSGKVQFFTSEDGISNNLLQTPLTYNDNSWHNVLVTFGSTGGKRIYLDGSLVASVSTYYVVYNSSNNLLIGDYAFGGNNFNGRLDDVQAYDFELNATQVSDIYNNGYVTAPTAGPIHHWKLGEEDTFSTNWTVKDSVGSLDGTSVNMEEADKKLGVAYSLQTDGVDERVDFGVINNFATDSPRSVSVWVRPISFGTVDSWFGTWSESTDSGWGVSNVGPSFRFILDGGGNTNRVYVRSLVNPVVNVWSHWVITYSGNELASGVKMYKDGSLVSVATITDNLTTTQSASGNKFVLGMESSETQYPSNLYQMEMSVYDTELSASDVVLLFNESGTGIGAGRGVPIDPRNVGLSPTFYCPMVGPNDTFSTDWTITDEIAGNNGTSVNMEEADKTSATP